MEECCAEIFLESLYLPADRALGHAEFPRGAGVAAQPGRAFERPHGETEETEAVS